MLSRKNYKETIRKQTPTKQHYTIKKLTVGVASVLIGLSFMGELEGDSVHADTMTAGSESTSVTSTTAQDGLKKSPQLYLQGTDTNNPSTPSSASSTGTIKNVTSSAAVQVKSASDEEDSDSTLAKGENKFAQSAVKDSVTDGKTSTAEINPAKLSSPALITQLNQFLAKSSTSDALKANDELEIKATDPTNYPNCGDVDGPLFELDSGQLVNKDEVISLKDMYIFQILKLVNTKDSNFQYVILTMNRKDTADRSVYLFVTGSNYSNAVVVKVKPNDTYELSKTGYSVTYTEPTTINGHDVNGSFYVTGSTYDDGFIMPDWQLQHLQIIYSLGNYDPSNTDATSVGEIMPSYEKVPVIKYSGGPSNISQPKVYIVGFTGQEFNVTDIINNYKKVFKGYYLQNPNVASMGTLSQFENGGYYLKTYYDNDGNVDFKGLYHQIDDQGTMSVSVLNADNETIVGPVNVLAGKSHSFNFNGHNWIARNPYVTSSAHEVILKYAKLGSVIPVDENGNKINDGWQYVNDPDDASKATSPYEKAPVIDGYVAVNPDETIVLPPILSSDTNIYYRKSIKVTYSGSDSKTYDGNPANFEPTTVQWSGLKGLNTSTLTSADFTWNTADNKAPTDAGKYTLSLNPTGEAALRKANPNYDLKTISGSYTYTINPLGIDKVTYSGSDSKTYDGNPANFEPTTVQWSGLKGLNTSTLTSADFTWNTADNKAPTAAGKYTLSLNPTGEAALRKANPNYDLKTISGSYTYTINPLGIDKVTYSGSDSKTYDGNPANFEPTTVQWSGLKGLNTSTLTSADFTWNTADNKAPTDAGKYTLSLNPTGEAALRKANPNYDLKTISGSYTYTINPLGIDKVTYSGSDSKTYDGNPANFEPTTVQWSGLKGLNTSTLTSADFTWNTADNKAPTDAGKYTLSLNPTGEAALRKANPNYDLKTISGSYTYTINPLGIDKVTYSGSDSKTYDGNPANFEPTTVQWSGLKGLNTSTLTSADFTWNTADNKAPTDAGKYTLSLNPTGEAALRKANPNYDLKTISGSYTYTINPLGIDKVTYSGSDSKTYDGNPANFEPTTVQWSGLAGLNTSTLTSADFTWNTTDQKAPTAAGKYTLSLNPTGEAALRKANPNYDLKTISGSYTYTINPLGIDKVTYSGSDSKTYDGNPANFDPTTVQWSGLKGLNTSTLTSADFTWNTTDQKAPTAAGKYTLSLNPTGEAALRKANPNYDLKTISGSYTYTINPLGIDKVTYSGSDSKTYDGNPANFDPTTVQWSGLAGLNTSTLTSADFTWNTADNKAPTAAGKYTLSLNPTGEAALRKANPNYDLKTISGSYTYTINPLGIDKVTYSGSDSKTYDGNPANFDPTTVQWSGLAGLNTSTLTSADFTWNTTDQKAPTAAGKYTLSLNPTGEAALRKANPNYDLKTISGSYTYTINPLGIDKVTYSGSDSKTYDGNPANFDPTTVQWSGLAGLNTSTLTSADFTWNTTDQKAPTAAGKYTLSLNPTGEAALRKANPNYDLKTISGSYTYTITPKMITEAQDVTYDGSYTKTYDGQAASVADIKDPTWTVKGLVNSDKYDHSGLTNEDFNWMKDGQPISGPEAGVGKYVLTLNQHGLDKLNQQNPNYQVDESALSGQYTYTINPLGIDKVTYSGSDSKTYDGNPANFDPTTVKWSGLAGLNTSTLTSADFTWNTTDQKAPTAAGKYTLSLNPTGEAALRKANPNYDLKTISGSYTYTITPKMITEAQDVTYDGSYTKTYDGQAASVADIKDPTWTVKGLVNSDKYDHSGLTNEDFNWMKDGQPISGPEAGVGKYVLTLNQHGLDKLNQQNPNYQVDESALSGQYTYTINPLGIDKVTYSGSDSKTYDGNPANFDPTTVKWSGLAGLNTSTLTSADFTWNTTDQKAPTAAGKYTLSLNPTGEAALRKANPNYDLKTISGSYTYTITPKMITEAQDVTYDGSYTKTYDGQAASVADIKDPTWTVKGLVNSDKYDHSGLTNEDFNWMKDGQPISGPEAGVGKYVLTLNQHGLDKLNQQNPNYQVDESALSGQYTYTINPLGIDKVTYSGSDSKTYDGNPANFDPTTVKWSGLAGLNTSTLTSADFTWNTTDQKAPTAAGKYTLSLNPTGEAALRKANPNYDLKTISGSYTYTINPLGIDKVTYSGSDSKTYDGNPANFDPTTVQWSGLAGLNTSTLTSADFTWNTTDQKAPTAAGKYTLSLNTTGEAALRKANPNYDLKTISGSYTYTITPKMITEAQDVTYDGSYTKTYDGQAASVADIKDPTWTVKGLVNSDKYDHSGLTNEDFNWMKDGQPISGPEAGVGKYVLTLNQHGLDKLNQQNPNYQVDESALSGQYTYTITPLTVVAVNYKGYDKKVYDGRPGVINLDKLVWDELPDGTNLNLSGLTSAYFSWDTPNHEAPTEVGRYTISLTKQGEDLLQSENPNYNFIKFTGTFIYDITPMAEVTVTYNGADGKIYDGQPGTINPAKLTWSKLPDGTSLKMPTWSAGDFAWDTADGLAPTAVGTYQIKLTDAGKAALKKANPNYDLSSITGVFTYEIKPAQTPETPGQTPEQQPGQTPEQQPDQNTNQSGTSENGFGPSARPNASTNSNASQLPQTGNDHSNTALAGLALASLIAMLGLGKKRKHD